jgi:hypothetical protein
MEDSSSNNSNTQERPIIKKQGIHKRTKVIVKYADRLYKVGKKRTRKNTPQTTKKAIAAEEKKYLSTKDAIQQAKAYV